MNSRSIVSEADLRQQTEAYGQGHLFAWWPELNGDQRRELLRQIALIDFPLVAGLADKLVRHPTPPAPVQLAPAPILLLPKSAEDRKRERLAAEQGESLLREGKAAPLVVAGGQGTRLGFDGPKGAFPIGPLSNKCLFAIFAEKILACQKRYGRPIPWTVMTSPANDRETREFFRRQDWFGLKEHQVGFFVQGTMPAVDRQGKILLAGKGEIAASPDGHGGTLAALVCSGTLQDLEERGIEEISYFQVDNVLVTVLDPVFLGHHARAGAEMSSKVLRKAYPEEKLGIVGLRDGRLGVIEYSDLSREDMAARGPDGELKYWAGSIAIHLIRTAFVRRLQAEGIRLPFHRAVKKVPFVDARGNRVEPEAPNGIKFESFIFDALEHARNPITLEVERRVEFSPVKNAEGVDSPATARRDLMQLHASWLEAAGAGVPRHPDGSLAVRIELSPLAVLDREEALRRFVSPPAISGDFHLVS